MAKKKKNKIKKWLDGEGLMDMTINTGETLTASKLHELYKTMSDAEQKALLKLLLLDGGLQKISTVAQDINTPGAVDLLLDQVCYYHFCRAVKEE